MQTPPSPPPGPAALLVFVRAPAVGQVKTRLAAAIGRNAALRVYRRMGRHVVDQARSLAGASVIVHFTPADGGPAVAEWLGAGPEYLPQAGADLGERMANAFGDAFRRGFARVVIIGSDLPGLEAAHLRRALDLLETHPAVIGPARDGGYWLLGLRGPAPGLFRAMTWSTPTVLGESLRRLRELGMEPGLLPMLTDVDEVADLPEGWLEPEDQR